MSIGFDNAIAFIMIFGLLVFLHELGHFVVAKWAGIRVQVFSLGFGPRLFGWRGPETDYRVSLVPLGGYVKMLGEETEMELVADPRDGEEEAAAGDGDDAFTAKPRWQRLLVMLAGGIMNMMQIQGPSWMVIELPLYLVVAWLAGSIEQRRRES